MKSKRADVPITLFVIGVFLVCSFALLSFLSAELNANNSFAGLKELDDLNSKILLHEFLISKGIDRTVVLKRLDAKEDEGQSFYYEERKGNTLFGKEKNLLFSVQYLIPN